MKYPLATVSIVLSLALLSSYLAAADIADPGKPKYANNFLGGFQTPTVAPGQRVDFSFNLTNPYDNSSPEMQNVPLQNLTMQNVTLVIGIYMYATQEKAEALTGSFPHPPLIRGTTTEWKENISEILSNQTLRIELPIYTSKKTPHGSYFSQSTYFVRFNLTFNFPDNSTDVVLKSRGCFTESEWNTIVSFEGNQSIVNTTYMKSLGVDGILPDSSFGIKIPIPRWPLGVIVVGCVGLSFMALYYFVLDNPGKYPRLEKRFYYLRGKLRETWGKLEHSRRK
jgi:opacity protein-like surface antigen